MAVRDRYNNSVPNSDTNQNLTVNVSTGRGQVADKDGRNAVGEDGRAGFDVTAASGAINFTLQNTSRSLSTANRSVNTSVVALGAVNDGGSGDDGDTSDESGVTGGNQSNCVTNTTASGGSDRYLLSFDLTNSGNCDSITLTKFGPAYDSNGNSGGRSTLLKKARRVMTVPTRETPR